MDMFVKVYNTHTQEEVFINKNKISWLTVDKEELIVSFVMDGLDEAIFIRFEDSDGVINFVRGVQGEVYRIPRAVITAKKL